MAVTIERTGNPVFPWRVSSECATLPEAMAKTARMEEVNPRAFEPGSLDALAIERSSADIPLPAHIEALVERAEADDDGPENLKAGEAYRDHLDGTP